MNNQIRIQIMDTFNIFINERQAENLAEHTRKGSNFLALLIMNEGSTVPNFKLLSTLWGDERSTNPENSLKTLVSRLRSMLNQMSPGFGKCIVADRGAYHFELLPNMTVDALELQEIFQRFGNETIPMADKQEDFSRMMKLYKGDLMQSVARNEWALSPATSMHNKYMSAVYDEVEYLNETKQLADVVSVCRTALEVDPFDDQLHIKLMNALIETGRTSDALVQYKHVVQMNYRYLGIQPSEDLQEFYRKIVSAGRTLDFNLEAIRNELRESSEYRGAFVCDYAVFKEIYNLQMRNLERLGSTMFLAVIMIGDPEMRDIGNIQQESIMSGVLDILRSNLRKGDTITHISPTLIAIMMPTVNYSTGNMVMERIKRLFYRKYASSNIAFNYRVGPLGSEEAEGKKPDTDPASKRRKKAEDKEK